MTLDMKIGQPWAKLNVDFIAPLNMLSVMSACAVIVGMANSLIDLMRFPTWGFHRLPILRVFNLGFSHLKVSTRGSQNRISKPGASQLGIGTPQRVIQSNLKVHRLVRDFSDV